MKYLLIPTILLFIISCSNKQKELIYQYEAEQIKEFLNVDIGDLSFKIESAEVHDTIFGKDSLDYHFNEFRTSYKDALETINESSYDTLIQNYTALHKLYDSIYKAAPDEDKHYYDDFEEKASAYLKYKEEVVQMKAMYTNYADVENEILSIVYIGKSSMLNPLLKLKQTHEKLYYTDSLQEKIVSDESIE